MKKLVLALVIANLFFLGWQLYKTEPVVAPPSAEEGAAPSLVLIAELPPGRRPEPRAPLVPDQLPVGIESFAADDARSPEQISHPTPPPLAVCFRLAGFQSAMAADRTKEILEKEGAGVGAAVAERYARTRYWVLLPASRNEAQAVSVVERLKRAGVKDYYLIPDGPNQNAISLGVFSSQEGAQRRVADMAGLQLKVRVEKVDYPGRRFALTVRWPGSAPANWRARVPAGVEVANTGCPATP